MSLINRYFLIVLIASLSMTNAVAFNNKNIDPTLGPPIHSTVILNPKAVNQPSFLLNSTYISKTPNASQAQPTVKDISLINFNLTADQKRRLFKGSSKLIGKSENNTVSFSRSVIPANVDLGMNNVPVLDQGQYGTCATFAATAALDAVLNKGEYVSPLCALQLGAYLNRRSFGLSGWEGTLAPKVLTRLEEFGVMSMKTQRANSCGKITEYPILATDDAGTEMSLEEYHSYSDDISNEIAWYPLLSFPQRYVNGNATFENVMPSLVNQVKEALASSSNSNPVRVLIGVLLPYQFCSNGACGTNKEKFDTWVLTKSLIAGINSAPDTLALGGHEMVITGYNDNIDVVDDEGRKHRGIFTLRNSWGNKAGDQGNYYMSYDFFMLFVGEINVIYKRD